MGALKWRRLPMVAAAMIALAVALWAGLERLGIQVPNGPETLPAAHGPLMVSGFLGTLISLERAVALAAPWAFGAPVLTAAGAVLLMLGAGGNTGPLLIVAGSLCLVTDFAVIVRRQAELFTIVMALGATAWLGGNILWAAGWPIPDLVFWWGAFLILTIMGERLELGRMRAPSASGRIFFIGAAALFIAGLIWSTIAPGAGVRVLGLGAIGFGAWILRYDVARQTIRARGLPRFVAVNLLLGAGWLMASGVMRAIFPADLTTFEYDAILHSMFLGFVFSMIFAHAPIIFPAVLGRPLPFRKIFYGHVAVLHLSLLLRVGGDLVESADGWQWGGILNVVALAMFVAITVSGIMMGAAHRPAPSFAPAPQPELEG
jgi:hypothetical protein